MRFFKCLETPKSDFKAHRACLSRKSLRGTVKRTNSTPYSNFGTTRDLKSNIICVGDSFLTPAEISEYDF